MTIKQQGGIFGRNPTFNDVNVEGSITVPNDSITGNAIQGGTLTVDVLGVGTTNPDGALEISSSSANEPIVKIATAHASGTNGRLEFETNWSGNIAVKASVEGSSENATNGNLVFKTQQSGSLTEAARFNSSGNLVFPSGKGIDFSATSGTGTSELFDDYEEGSHTVSLTVNSGTASLSKNILQYTKIGRLVHVYGMLRVSTVSSPSGAVSFTLPFTAASSSGSDERGTRFSAPVNLSASLNANEFELDLSAGTATVDMLNTSSGTISTTNVGESLQANTTIPVNITYAVE